MRGIKRAGGFLWSIPIGFQLSTIYAVLLATVLTLLGFALYSRVDTFLIQNTADRLSSTTQPLVGRPFVFDRGRMGDRLFDPSSPNGLVSDPQAFIDQQIALTLVRGLSGPDVAVAVLNDSGHVITSTTSVLTGDQPYIPPLPQGWETQLPQNETPHWIASAPSGGRRLVALTPIQILVDRALPPQNYYIEQVASLESGDAVLNQLRVLLVLGIVVGTLLGVLAGLALTRVVLRPLDRMARTAAAIEAGDLDRRLRLPPGHNEVARLGHAFDGMVDRLASALEAQRRFVADASHELRTPLTSLEGLSEMLLIGADRGDMGTVQRTLRSMHNEIGRLGRLVTDLLTLSRLDSPNAPAAVSYATFDACALLQGVAEQVQPMAEQRGVRLLLRCGGPVPISGEADKLKQVILNLVDNALRYTPPGGEVTLSAVLDVPHGQARLEVEDTGPGIAPADMPHVFDRFYRGDLSRARSTGNSGLGLAIARSIVQAHRGTISVRSVPGRGACFTVALPASHESLLPRPAPVMQQPPVPEEAHRV